LVERLVSEEGRGAIYDADAGRARSQTLAS